MSEASDGAIALGPCAYSWCDGTLERFPDRGPPGGFVERCTGSCGHGVRLGVGGDA